MSSSTLDGGNYHSISPNKAGVSQRSLNTANQLHNQIGKPLVAPQQYSTPHPSQVQQQQQLILQRQRQQQAGQAHTRATVQYASAPQVFPATKDALGAGGCRYAPLRDFSAVSFDVGDLVIRDNTLQPCYLLTISAFVRFDDNWYFPLRNFRPHPTGAYRVQFSHSGDAGGERLVLDCSPPQHARNNADRMDGADDDEEPPQRSIMSASLVSQERASRPFFEELTVQVDCGFLVLRLRGDGTYLVLDDIGFYKDRNVASLDAALRGKDKTASRTKKPYARLPAPPVAEATNLIFLSSPSSANQTGAKSPLIVMPTNSRYVCHNRVVLTGANSVQLVLERFELKRLTNEPDNYLARTAERDPYERDPYVEGRPRRDVAGATTIIYKNPMNAGE